ncbi:restriction endonuclease subunit S [Campylobacter devanensis]|uniref:restriction endonuclease subunit S n=1 Tax=Campylobacter devanensis TaxID=3161138 RepID=UPI001F33D05C|nr:restriction endonuclease subunit S [Campylobacter sp. P157]
MFDIKTTSQKLSKKDSVENGKFPIYSAESQNGGICGYCNEIPAFTISNEKPFFVIFGDHTRAFNIAKNDFCVADNVKVLEPKNFNIKSILLIITIWQKGIPNLGYARHWSIAKNIQIKLPITASGEIDFEFMESFVAELEAERVAELEAERVAELEAYLAAASLKDYELTADELTALSKFENYNWGEFRIGDLFDSSNGNFDIQKSHINDKGYFVVTAGETNNGILGKSDIEARIFEANTITIDMFGFVFFRQFEYKMVTHARVFSLKPKFKTTHKQGLFLASLFKHLKTKFGYDNMCSWAKIKDDKIQLPINKDGNIDFEFMNNFIKAIKKLVIKDVVLYTDNKIKATKSIVSSNQ